MLLQRVVVLFPAVQVLVAEKALDIIWVARLGIEEEAGTGKLLESVGGTTMQGLAGTNEKRTSKADGDR